MGPSVKPTSTERAGRPPVAYASACNRISVPGLVRTRSVSERRLDCPGSPKYSGATTTPCWSSARAARACVPSAWSVKVARTATSQISAPCSSRAKARSALNRVLFWTAHIAGPDSVDLHVATANAVGRGRSTQYVRAPESDRSVAQELDARLAAPQDDLLFAGQHDALSVGLDLDGQRCNRLDLDGLRCRWLLVLQNSNDDRTRR